MNVLDTPRHRSAPGPAWLAFVAILSLLPRPAPGDEAHLAWNACPADGGTPNQTFACDTNTGANVLFGSFILGEAATFPGAWGVEARVVIGQYGTQSLVPSWWRFDPDGCRPGALSASFDFTSDPLVACADPFSGHALASPLHVEVVTTPDLPPHGSQTYERVTFGASMTDPATLEAGAEYVAFRLRISNAETRGTGACTGCCQELGIALEQLVVGDGTSHFFLNQPAVSWQGFGSPCQATNQTPSSWGRIRGWYR